MPSFTTARWPDREPHVLGVTHDEAVVFAEHDLEIWGHAHRDYDNMIPFARSRRALHALAGRHGARPLRAGSGPHEPLRPSWLFSDDAIAATGCRLPGARPLGDRA